MSSVKSELIDKRRLAAMLDATCTSVNSCFKVEGSRMLVYALSLNLLSAAGILTSLLNQPVILFL